MLVMMRVLWLDILKKLYKMDVASCIYRQDLFLPIYASLPLLYMRYQEIQGQGYDTALNSECNKRVAFCIMELPLINGGPR
jgi:hypothetical protein